MVSSPTKQSRSNAGRSAGWKAPARTGVVIVSLSGDQARALQATVRGTELVVQRWGAAPAGSDDESRARAVAGALNKASIQDRHVVLCLPAQSVVIKRVELPPCPPDQLPQVVAFEAQRYLPLPLDQLVTGFQPLKSNGGKSTGSDVLLAVAKKADLQRQERALKSAGITVDGYGIEPLGVTDAYLPASEAGSNGHARLMLAQEGGGIHAQVLQGSRLLFNRYLPVTGEEWAQDLRRSLAAYSLDQPDAPIDEAILIGDAAESTDPEGALRALGVPVRRLALSPAQMGGLDVPADWGGLVGVARQWLGLGQYSLKLRPQGWQEAKTGQSPIMMALAALAAVGLMAGLVLWRLDQEKKQGQQSAEVLELTGRIAKEKKALSTLTQQRDDARRQLDAVGGSREQAYAPLEALRDVALHAPSGVWLTQMSYQDGQPIQFTGTSRSPGEVLQFVNSLEANPRFRKVDLGFLQSAEVGKRKTPVTHFRVQCLLSTRSNPAEVTR